MRKRITEPGIRLSGAGLVLSALASSALAADLGPYPKAAQPHYEQPDRPWTMRWSGLYGGIQAGYSWTKVETSAIWGQVGGPTEAFAYHPNGAIGGVHLGFNRQAGNLVAGIEADIEASSVSGTGYGNFSALHDTTIDWLGSVRGRLGYAFGRSMIYATGGIAFAGLSNDQITGNALTPYTSDSQWKTGWTLGAGVEHALSSNLTARVEYRYVDLGTAAYYSPALNMRETNDIHMHTVRAGLSFKF